MHDLEVFHKQNELCSGEKINCSKRARDLDCQKELHANSTQTYC